MTKNTLEEGIFPNSLPLAPCSWASCGAGHTWKPTFALAVCSGCGSPTLAQKMENCPICNEPMEKVSLRVDFLPPGGGISQRCKGEPSRGDSCDVEISHKQEETE